MRSLRFANQALALVVMLAVIAVAVSGCRLRSFKVRPFGEESHPAAEGKTAPVATLVEVAGSERLWTGIAVSKKGRIFVNYPRWSEDVPFSVGEILESGVAKPFPNAEWNAWDASKPAGDHLICVQSVYVDEDGFLWILDPANAYFRGVVADGAKLLKVDLAKDRIVQKIIFDETIAPPTSYLNDVRVDTKEDVAYITDSGLGALVVVDLKTGRGRRLLGDHPSTKSEKVVLTIGGQEWRINGLAPEVHSDGLALDADGKFLYYQALTARTLYRIETRWLLDPSLSGWELGTKVESMGQTGAADGIEFGPDGYLYLTAIEDNAINIFAALDRVKTVVEDPRLLWPDSITRGPDGYLYVTTSQIHLGADRTEPYRVFKFKPMK